ncbi:hypothetical protein chiPu_0006801 [Chiloscyllium punctatum]|uniref:Uncharacterized protein n=1 Tax=Chiloscyllium punctatum TaxID=137246 RepID=A0A401SDA1_CHIPU|nr:hypothetical protein [Chiloscyllium punctatum]
MASTGADYNSHSAARQEQRRRSGARLIVLSPPPLPPHALWQGELLSRAGCGLHKDVLSQNIAFRLVSAAVTLYSKVSKMILEWGGCMKKLHRRILTLLEVEGTLNGLVMPLENVQCIGPDERQPRILTLKCCCLTGSAFKLMLFVLMYQ